MSGLARTRFRLRPARDRLRARCRESLWRRLRACAACVDGSGVLPRARPRRAPRPGRPRGSTGDCGCLRRGATLPESSGQPPGSCARPGALRASTASAAALLVGRLQLAKLCRGLTERRLRVGRSSLMQAQRSEEIVHAGDADAFRRRPPAGRALPRTISSPLADVPARSARSRCWRACERRQLLSSSDRRRTSAWSYDVRDPERFPCRRSISPMLNHASATLRLSPISCAVFERLLVQLHGSAEIALVRHDVGQVVQRRRHAGLFADGASNGERFEVVLLGLGEIALHAMHDRRVVQDERDRASVSDLAGDRERLAVGLQRGARAIPAAGARSRCCSADPPSCSGRRSRARPPVLVRTSVWRPRGRPATGARCPRRGARGSRRRGLRQRRRSVGPPRQRRWPLVSLPSSCQAFPSVRSALATSSRAPCCRPFATARAAAACCRL